MRRTVGRDRDRGEFVFPVGFVESRVGDSGVADVVGEPAEFRFVASDEQDDRVADRVPVFGDAGVLVAEVDRCVSCLARLDTRWEIFTGDDVQAG